MLINSLNDSDGGSGGEAQQLPSETHNGWTTNLVKDNQSSLARTPTTTPPPGWFDLRAAQSPYFDSDHGGDMVSSSLCSLSDLDENGVEAKQQENPNPTTYTPLPTSITLALSAASSYHSNIHSNCPSHPHGGLGTTMSMGSNLAFPSISTLSCVSNNSNSSNSLYDSNCDNWDALPQQQHRHHFDDWVSMESLERSGVVVKDNMGRKRELILGEQEEEKDELEQKEREQTHINTMHDVRSGQAQKQQHLQQQQTQGEQRTIDIIGHAGYTQRVCAGTTTQIRLHSAVKDEGDEDEEEQQKDDGDLCLCDQTRHEGAQEKEVIRIDHGDDDDKKHKDDEHNKVKEGERRFESEACCQDEGAHHAQSRDHGQRNERYRRTSEHAHEHELEQVKDMPKNEQRLHGHLMPSDNTGKTLSSRSPSPTESILTSTPPSPASSPASSSPSSPYASTPFSFSAPHPAPSFTPLGASTLPIVSVNLQHTPSPTSILLLASTLTNEHVKDSQPLFSPSLPLSTTPSAPNDPSQRFEVLERLGFGYVPMIPT